MRKDIEVFADILLDEIGLALKSFNMAKDLLLEKDYPLINEYIARMNGKIDASLFFIELINRTEERWLEVEERENDFKKINQKDF